MGATAVLDVGKTNVKLALFAPDGALLWERATPNRPLLRPPYPHADVEAIWSFLIGALRDANGAHAIEAIIPTTHGSAGAFVTDEGLALPVLDYEFDGVEAVEPRYRHLRPPYAQTLSPSQPGGLNLGRQIAWQMQEFPQACAGARAYLTYPQYWSWRLCGVAAAEVTMLGAHSDLWAPREGDYSSLVADIDLARRLPPLRKAGAALGPIKPEFAAATGLAPGALALNGVHDSNASLLPHLAAHRAPFTVVSTGTWVILMAPGLGLEGLRERDDMLANVDVEGRPIPCARFMGGREYQQICQGANNSATAADVADLLSAGAMALPCFAPQGGPFAARQGEIIGAVAPDQRPALATLYLALMTDLSLTRLGAVQGDLIVEGSFAANECFCSLLGALRPRQRVLMGADAAGAARGAALLRQWPHPSAPPPRLRHAAPASAPLLGAYAENWRARL